MAYEPRKYRFEDMSGSFQSDLCEKDEQLNIDKFMEAASESEAFSAYNDLSTDEGLRSFAETLNTFDARLIGLANEWAEADDREYIRDGLMFDGKTASEVMYDKGISFSDCLCMAQNSFDNPDKSEFGKVCVSIGGPAFQTGKNVVDDVLENGQIHFDNRDISDLKVDFSIEPSADKAEKNREFITLEQEKYFSDVKLGKSQQGLADLIEREESALKIFPKDASGKVSFSYIAYDGRTMSVKTDEESLSTHRSEFQRNEQTLHEHVDIKKLGKKVKERERVSLSDLEDSKPKLHRRRDKDMSASKEKSIDRKFPSK